MNRAVALKTVAYLVHIISKHLDKPKTYARALFLDFSSAFNTIQADILVAKMVQQKLNPYLIHWYALFLTNRVVCKGNQNPYIGHYNQCCNGLVVMALRVVRVQLCFLRSTPMIVVQIQQINL